MDKNITGLTMAAVAVKKSLFSGSVFASMTIFNDPAYIITGVVGAILSMASAHYDFRKLQYEHKIRGEKCNKNLKLMLNKAFIIGFILSMLSFTLFLSVGDELITKALHLEKGGQFLPSLWLLLTMIVSIDSVKIFNYINNIFLKEK